MYVVRCADQGFAVSSIRVHLAAIRTAHLLAGLSLDLRHPRLAMVVEGVTRVQGHPAAPPGRPRGARRAAPDARCAAPSPDTPLGARDRAMLLVGFGAALRRSELVALTLGDVETVPGRGLRAAGAPLEDRPAGPGPGHRRLGQPGRAGLLPARRARRLAGRTGAPPPTSTGPPAPRPAPSGRCSAPSPRPAGSPATTLSDKAVARLVKQAALDAGLDPERYSGHSLRAGLATAAGDQGAGLAELMRQTRHKSTEVALGYLRPADLWRNNVTEGVFRETAMVASVTRGAYRRLLGGSGS